MASKNYSYRQVDGDDGYCYAIFDKRTGKQITYASMTRQEAQYQIKQLEKRGD